MATLPVARAAAGDETVARSAPSRSAAPPTPDEDGPTFAWPDALTLASRRCDDWNRRIALLAQEQLAYCTEAGGELLATGQALACESDPGRRLELTWVLALHQMERAMAASSRLVELLTATGDPSAEARTAPEPRLTATASPA